MKPCHICGGVPPLEICSACIPPCDMIEGQCSKELRLRELQAELLLRPAITPEMAKLMREQYRGIACTVPSMRAFNTVMKLLEEHGKKAAT